MPRKVYDPMWLCLNICWVEGVLAPLVCASVKNLHQGSVLASSRPCFLGRLSGGEAAGQEGQSCPFPAPGAAEVLLAVFTGMGGSALGPPPLLSLPLPIIHEASDENRGLRRVGVAVGPRMTFWSLGVMKRVF